MALRIQTVWRVVRAKHRVALLKTANINARILTRKLHRLVRKHIFHLKYIWQQQRAGFVVVIQTFARRALASMRVAKLVSLRRAQSETLQFITTRLHQLLAATQLQILRDTMKVTIGTTFLVAVD